LAGLRKRIVCVPKATRHATAWDQVTAGFAPVPRACAAGKATIARSTSKSSTTAGMLMALRGDLEPCGFGTSLTPSRCPPCGEERILATPGIRDRRGRVDLPDPARAGAPASRRARHWRRASQRRGCRRLRDAQRGGHGIRTPRGFLEESILPGANYQTKPMRRPAFPPSMPRRRPRRRTGQCARCQRPANGSGRHKGFPHAARQGHLFRGGPSRTRENPDRPATKWSKEAEARIL